MVSEFGLHSKVFRILCTQPQVQMVIDVAICQLRD